jgi:hypothetical protein
MLVGGVVENEIQGQADAFCAQCGRQSAKIIHCPDVRVDRPIVADRISAVVATVGDGKQGHQVKIGQPQFFKVGDMVVQFGKVVAK